MSGPGEARASEEERVGAVLAALRSGVRQRRAELTTLGDDAEARLRLLDLKAKEFVEEPVPVSPRPMVGRFLILARKALFHLGFKWYVRPVLQQQNDFNQAVSSLAQDLARRQDEIVRQLDGLARRLGDLERRLDEPASSGPAAEE
ncbi:MAG TPA: hypothetical protein VN783_10305 [Thermoanaerobaculia bacterium]|nr:hypothetical protein [Thermoanaerobaculia bacterium]